MNYLSLLLVVCLTFSGFSQSALNLEFNNIRARIHDHGYFFHDLGNSAAAYEYPKGSNKFAIYAMNYWMGGKDGSGQLHLAAGMYGTGHDFFPGPIANDYNSTYYQANFLTSMWSVSKSDIDYHVAHYLDGGYVVDQTILNWPGNGNVTEGVAAQLAPYVDVNQNQIYDPLNGDYPFILGDFAVYTIMNDAAQIHTETGGDQLGVEVHSMYYQYATNNDLNNTTFLHLKVYNRSNTDYSDFIYGLWMDPDIGQAQNDYLGCDSTRNLGYAYNGEPYDYGQAGQDPYITLTPAVGAVFLNSTMHKFVYFNSGGGVQGDPSSAAAFYNYLNGNWTNGAPMTYGGNGLGGTVATSYIYSGNPYSGTGWNEVTEGNPPGDRRFLMSAYEGDLMAQSDKCMDVAFVINNDDADNLLNVENLFVTTDFVQDFYDNSITPCEQVAASTSENTTELVVEVYPNPAENDITIYAGSAFEYELMDIKGVRVLIGNSSSPSAQLDLKVESGMYLLKITTDKGTVVKKLQIR